MKKGIFLIILFISNQTLYSTMACNPIYLTTPKNNWMSFFNTLKQQSNINIFVETGTYLGDTTALASDCFESVHTIEILPHFFEKAVDRFKNVPNVSVHLGDSAKIFPILLPKIDSSKNSILFWLDGHFMDCSSEKEISSSNTEYTPIIGEIEHIKKHGISNCIIMVDDARLFGSLLDGKRIERAGKSYYPLLRDTCNQLGTHFSYKIFGDILMLYDKSFDLIFSPLVDACTMSRLFDGSNYSTEEILNAESIIAKAQGEELQAVRALYRDFSAPWKQWYNKSPHYNLWYGLTLQHEGYHELACEQFKEVINLGYDHWRIFWYLAESLYYRKKYQESLTYIKIVLDHNTDFKPGKELLEEIATLANQSSKKTQ